MAHLSWNGARDGASSGAAELGGDGPDGPGTQLWLGAAFGGGDVWGTRERSGAAPGGYGAPLLALPTAPGSGPM